MLYEIYIYIYKYVYIYIYISIYICICIYITYIEDFLNRKYSTAYTLLFVLSTSSSNLNLKLLNKVF